MSTPAERAGELIWRHSGSGYPPLTTFEAMRIVELLQGSGALHELAECDHRDRDREIARAALHYGESWLWGAEFEQASDFLRKNGEIEKILDQMEEDECLTPLPAPKSGQ